MTKKKHYPSAENVSSDMGKNGDFPAMPLYVKDWLTGSATVRMTPEQRGAFIDLLAHAWQANPPCTLPNDGLFLKKTSGLGRRFSTVGSFVIAQFKPLDDDPTLLRNDKQYQVYLSLLERRGKNQSGAEKTNEKRWGSIAERSVSDQPAIDSSIASRVGDGNANETNLPHTKNLNSSQESVALVLDAFAADIRPHPALVAKWVSQLGSAEAVRDLVLQYPNKPAAYIGQCVTTAARKGTYANRSDRGSAKPATATPTKPAGAQRFHQATYDELVAAGKLPAVPKPTDGGPDGSVH